MSHIQRWSICGALGVLGTVALLTLAFRGESVGAQRRGRSREPDALLSTIAGLKCAFAAGAAGTWEGGAPAAAVKPPASVTLTFTDIEIQEGSAQAEGLGAPSHVTVQLAGSNLHFLDIRSSGALAITTVFSQESRNGRLKAVHSRSDFVSFPGSASPPDVSQYYGDCEVTQRQ